jgi:hypothetical protein
LKHRLPQRQKQTELKPKQPNIGFLKPIFSIS